MLEKRKELVKSQDALLSLHMAEQERWCKDRDFTDAFPGETCTRAFFDEVRGDRVDSHIAKLRTPDGSHTYSNIHTILKGAKETADQNRISEIDSELQEVIESSSALAVLNETFAAQETADRKRIAEINKELEEIIEASSKAAALASSRLEQLEKTAEKQLHNRANCRKTTP